MRSCSAPETRGLPDDVIAAVPPERAPAPADAAGQPQPQPVQQRGGRGLRGVAAAGLRRRRLIRRASALKPGRSGIRLSVRARAGAAGPAPASFRRAARDCTTLEIGNSMPWRAAWRITSSTVWIDSTTWPISRTASASVWPRPNARPRRRLRDSSPVQVSTRSPSPARPISVSGRAADRRVEPQHFVEAARDQAGARVEAEVHAVGGAGGHGEHVLHRAAEFGAAHVVAGVGAECRAVQHVGDVLRERRRRPNAPSARSAGPARLPWRTTAR